MLFIVHNYVEKTENVFLSSEKKRTFWGWGHVLWRRWWSFALGHVSFCFLHSLQTPRKFKTPVFFQIRFLLFCFSPFGMEKNKQKYLVFLDPLNSIKGNIWTHQHSNFLSEFSPGGRITIATFLISHFIIIFTHTFVGKILAYFTLQVPPNWHVFPGPLPKTVAAPIKLFGAGKQANVFGNTRVNWTVFFEWTWDNFSLPVESKNEGCWFFAQGLFLFSYSRPSAWRINTPSSPKSDKIIFCYRFKTIFVPLDRFRGVSY